MLNSVVQTLKELVILHTELFLLAGHVFNMPHDNVRVCEEAFGRLRTNHMMSPTLIQIDRTNPWSACSAAIITDFLDSGHGEWRKRGRLGAGHGLMVASSRHQAPGSLFHSKIGGAKRHLGACLNSFCHEEATNKR